LLLGGRSSETFCVTNSEEKEYNFFEAYCVVMLNDISFSTNSSTEEYADFFS